MTLKCWKQSEQEDHCLAPEAREDLLVVFRKLGELADVPCS
jgi:hypothetical protein